MVEVFYLYVACLRPYQAFSLSVPEADGAKVLVALYFENTLVGISIKDAETKDYKGSITTDTAADSYKLMLWDDLVGILPLRKAVSKNIN